MPSLTKRQKHLKNLSLRKKDFSKVVLHDNEIENENDNEDNEDNESINENDNESSNESINESDDESSNESINESDDESNSNSDNEISWDTDLDSNCSYFVKVLQNEINNYKPSARRSVYLGNAPRARRFHAAQAKKTSEDNGQMIYKKLFLRQINLLNIWNIIDKD
ncbi:3768_t:CDS:1 [Entrophospora sp. SA101]|nr:6367_t:CDS:1 [Entrophospora sp. SA101]CAJ0838010.1 6370_t:CDS:1 [Entrophospora sp. SA101]CAJ0839283.1 3768_t:CDS:1 [Entrophospora sp. SA101]